MVSTNDIRPGQSLIIEGSIYLILEYQHVKPGKGKAFVKTKLKNLSDGGVVDKTFRADENVEQAFIDKQSFNYLYKDNNDYVFMNNETYEQINLNEMIIEDKYLFMKENQEITQLPCNHCFMTDSIERWLQTEKAECPVCRKKIDSIEVRTDCQERYNIYSLNNLEMQV